MGGLVDLATGFGVSVVPVLAGAMLAFILQKSGALASVRRFVFARFWVRFARKHGASKEELKQLALNAARADVNR